MLLERTLERPSIPTEQIAELARLIRLRTNFSLDETFPLDVANSVRVPTLVYQVHDDS